MREDKNRGREGRKEKKVRKGKKTKTKIKKDLSVFQSFSSIHKRRFLLVQGPEPRRFSGPWGGSALL